MSKKHRLISDYVPPPYKSSFGNKDRYIILYQSQMESEAFLSLTKSQQCLYMWMAFQQYAVNEKDHPGKDNAKFFFNRRLYKDVYRLYSNDKSFEQDRDALIEKGFIKCINPGANTRSKAVYQYSDKWDKYGKPGFEIASKEMSASLLRKKKKENP